MKLFVKIMLTLAAAASITAGLLFSPLLQPLRRIYIHGAQPDGEHDVHTGAKIYDDVVARLDKDLEEELERLGNRLTDPELFAQARDRAMAAAEAAKADYIRSLGEIQRSNPSEAFSSILHQGAYNILLTQYWLQKDVLKNLPADRPLTIH